MSIDVNISIFDSFMSENSHLDLVACPLILKKNISMWDLGLNLPLLIYRSLDPLSAS